MEPAQNPRRYLELLIILVQQSNSDSRRTLKHVKDARDFMKWFTGVFDRARYKFSNKIFKAGVDLMDLSQETFGRVFEWAKRNVDWLRDHKNQDGRLYRIIETTIRNILRDKLRRKPNWELQPDELDQNMNPEHLASIANCPDARDFLLDEETVCRTLIPRFLRELSEKLLETAFAIMHYYDKLGPEIEVSGCVILHHILILPKGRHIPDDLTDYLKERFPGVSGKAISGRIRNLRRAFLRFIDRMNDTKHHN